MFHADNTERHNNDQRNMNQVPLGGYGGYYYDGYQDPVDRRLGTPAVYYDRQYAAIPGRVPPPAAPTVLFPQVSPDYYQLTPEVSRDVGFGNHQYVPDQRKPQSVRPTGAVTTKNLTDAEFKKITDGWQKSGSGYTSVIIGGDGNIIQEDMVDSNDALKHNKWRISQRKEFIPPAEDKKLPRSSVQQDLAYPPVVQSRVTGYPTALPDQRMYPPAAASALGPYYRRAPAEVTYQPYPGYY